MRYDTTQNMWSPSQSLVSLATRAQNKSDVTTILTYADAANLVLARAVHLAAATARPTEKLPLHEALHRVLAATIHADRDLPPFHRSTRDGYAVQAAALSRGDWLPVIGILRAGEAPRPRRSPPTPHSRS